MLSTLRASSGEQLTEPLRGPRFGDGDTHLVAISREKLAGAFAFVIHPRELRASNLALLVAGSTRIMMQLPDSLALRQ